MNLLLVFVGGGLGSVARVLTGKAVGAALGDKFPFGTLAVIGMLIPIWARHGKSVPPYAFLVTGVLGGFTTFSALGLETFEKFATGRTNLALLNIALNVIAGLAAVGAGARVGRVFG